MQERIIRFVAANSRISEDRFRQLMFRTGELARDVGTVLVGAEAVREGIIDAVGGLRDALAKLRELIAHQEREVRTPWTSARMAPPAPGLVPPGAPGGPPGPPGPPGVPPGVPPPMPPGPPA